MRTVAISLAALFVTASAAAGGPAWGPPGWLNVPLDAAVGPGARKLPGRFWMEGTWNGNGSQDNGANWNIRLTVQKQGVGNYYYKVDYPSLDCGGYWTFSDGNGITGSFTEHIVYGRSKCIDGGTITVGALAGSSGPINRMVFRWNRLQSDGKKDFVQATLTRN